jgi:hypothetical protein
VKYRGRDDHGFELLLPIHHSGKHSFKLQEAPLPYLKIVFEGLNDHFSGSWIRRGV